MKNQWDDCSFVIGHVHPLSLSLFACLLTLITKPSEELIRRFFIHLFSDLIVFHVETFNVYYFLILIRFLIRRYIAR